MTEHLVSTRYIPSTPKPKNVIREHPGPKQRFPHLTVPPADPTDASTVFPFKAKKNIMEQLAH